MKNSGRYFLVFLISFVLLVQYGFSQPDSSKNASETSKYFPISNLQGITSFKISGRYGDPILYYLTIEFQKRDNSYECNLKNSCRDRQWSGSISPNAFKKYLEGLTPEKFPGGGTADFRGGFFVAYGTAPQKLYWQGRMFPGAIFPKFTVSEITDFQGTKPVPCDSCGGDGMIESTGFRVVTCGYCSGKGCKSCAEKGAVKNTHEYSTCEKCKGERFFIVPMQPEDILEW